MDCEAPSLRGFAPCGRISPDACGGTKWTAKPPLSGDLLPTVAFPLTPAAGFAKGHKRNRSGKPGGSFMSFCGERGSRIFVIGLLCTYADTSDPLSCSSVDHHHMLRHINESRIAGTRFSPCRTCPSHSFSVHQRPSCRASWHPSRCVPSMTL